jgi:hypothetical protein
MWHAHLARIQGRVEHPSGAAPPGTPHARATLEQMRQRGV